MTKHISDTAGTYTRVWQSVVWLTMRVQRDRATRWHRQVEHSFSYWGCTR